MDTHRTTTSGSRLTLITGLAMAPVDRAEADRLCRIRSGEPPSQGQDRSFAQEYFPVAT